MLWVIDAHPRRLDGRDKTHEKLYFGLVCTCTCARRRRETVVNIYLKQASTLKLLKRRILNDLPMYAFDRQTTIVHIVFPSCIIQSAPCPTHSFQGEREAGLSLLRTLLVPLDCFPSNDAIRRCGLDLIQDLEVFNAVTTIARFGSWLILVVGRRDVFVLGGFGFVQEPACGEVVDPYWGAVEGSVF
jgi:hypothetical protein